ncbi:hypothetical protein [Psychrobacter sp. I-STPA6b]|uniref:hypothetical protein n=1 Tax=Psychrobacter sp. I-STPA6b TaxID=2585718 RepID=UPI001D0C7FD1|nr:hypothetical protein [Psychrobacter sp. I-STPA6b]
MQIIQLTFLGLSRKYHLRNLVVGFAFCTFIWLMTDYVSSRSTTGGLDSTYILVNRIYLVISALLYPYAKYFYDWLWDLFFDDEVWVLGGILLLIVLYFKFIIRAMLFMFAIGVAPLGLITLYFVNKK